VEIKIDAFQYATFGDYVREVSKRLKRSLHSYPEHKTSGGQRYYRVVEFIKQAADRVVYEVQYWPYVVEKKEA
jgi:hypothetical protein